MDQSHWCRVLLWLPASARNRLRLPIGAHLPASIPPPRSRPALPLLPRPARQEAVEAVEIAAKTLAAPQERLKRLLEATDKKAVLLEMAGGWVGGWVAGWLGW